jgi:hypothetical protein
MFSNFSRGAFVFASQRKQKEKAFGPFGPRDSGEHVFFRQAAAASVTGFCNSQYHIPTRSGARQTRTRHGAHSGGAVARPRVPERDLAAHRASRPGDGASRRVSAAPDPRDRSRRRGSQQAFSRLARHRRGTPARPPRLSGRPRRTRGVAVGYLKTGPTAPDRPRPTPAPPRARRLASRTRRAHLDPSSPLPPRRLRPRLRARASRHPGR